MIDIPVIFGPTGSGKSRLALHLAASLAGVEIISADSRQVYRGLDIGTAKPTTTEQSTVRHHCLDLAHPDQRFSAGLFAHYARRAVLEIIGRGGVPLVVGGTGFYIRGLFDGLSAPMMDCNVESRLWELARAYGFEMLLEQLSVRDPESAAVIPATSHVRIVRALACIEQTGIPYSSYPRCTPQPSDLRPHYLALVPDRTELYTSIDDRFNMMVDGGMVEEASSAIDRYGYAAHALRGVGYREVIAYLAGKVDRARMIEMGQQATRRFAKRQFTWMRGVVFKNECVTTIDPARSDLAVEWLGRVMTRVRKAHP